MHASTKGNIESVCFLLGHDAYVDLQSENGNTALMYACKEGHPWVVSSLLCSGASVNLKNKDGASALTLATSEGHQEIVSQLLDHEALINSQDKNGCTALILASLMNLKDIVCCLLDRGAQIDLQDQFGRTALICASSRGYCEIVTILLDRGASVDLQSKSGSTALFVAAGEGQKNIVSILLTNRASLDISNENGHSPLMLASENGDLGVVTLLLERGANINLQDLMGSTALMKASSRGHANIVSSLLEKGAAIDFQDKGGRTALNRAVKENAYDCISVLEKHYVNLALELTTLKKRHFDRILAQASEDVGLSVDLYEELQLLRRDLFLREKAMKHTQLHSEILRMEKVDKGKIVELSKELAQLKYDPKVSRSEESSLNDLTMRTQQLLTSILQRETQLLINQDEHGANLCQQNYHALLQLALRVGLSSSVLVPVSQPINPQELSMCLQQFQITCGSNLININPDRCHEIEEQSGIFYGIFNPYGTLKLPVVIKVNHHSSCNQIQSRDLDHEYQILTRLNLRTLNQSPFLQLISYENSPSLPFSYLVLEDYGYNLTTIMRCDNQIARKTIFIPLLLTAVAHLHRQQIMHGDLKPHNILIKQIGHGSYQMKLCDFETAQVIGLPLRRDARTDTLKFSSSWVCPEIFHLAQRELQGEVGVDQIMSSLSIDLFSLGLLIDILCRKECYPSSLVLPSVTDDPNHLQLRRIFSEQTFLYSEIDSLKGSHSQSDIVKKLLSFDPFQRGNIFDVLEKYQNIIDGTKGFHSQKFQQQRIQELTELINRLKMSSPSQSEDRSTPDIPPVVPLTRNDLEGSLSDLMSYVSSMMDLQTTEIIDRLLECTNTAHEREEVLNKLTSLKEELLFN